MVARWCVLREGFLIVFSPVGLVNSMIDNRHSFGHTQD